jgi:hypothetical protein
MRKVISNNVAVCLLYAGRLKEGLQILETSITADTANIQVPSSFLLATDSLDNAFFLYRYMKNVKFLCSDTNVLPNVSINKGGQCIGSVLKH